ncbi:MAG: hypothetical protein JNG90_15860, partial [Planctomycetaceae bacterium]|nr:hypothetical protein [Planctomycetaceae bacterium]
MSRLNRAFIKAFERQPEVEPPVGSAVDEAPAPIAAEAQSTESHLTGAAPHWADAGVAVTEREQVLTVVDAPRSSPALAVAAEAVFTEFSATVRVADRPTRPTVDEAPVVADDEDRGWTPPYLHDGPSDWRSVAQELPASVLELPTAPESPRAAPDSAPRTGLPRQQSALGDPIRIDPSHAVPLAPPAAELADEELLADADPWLPPLIEPLAAAQYALHGAATDAESNEPALQVDSFAWPATCLSLLECLESEFASLVEELFAGAAQGRKVLAISGYRRNAGRTTFLLATARALAARGARVAILDADWDYPHLAERLGVAPESGWQDVLCNQLPLAEAMIESLIDGVTLLPARKAGRGAGTADLGVAERNLAWLRSAYDFVLLDTGRLDDPGEEKIGSLLLEKMPIDGVLLVHDVSTSTL